MPWPGSPTCGRPVPKTTPPTGGHRWEPLRKGPLDVTSSELVALVGEYWLVLLVAVVGALAAVRDIR